MTAHKAMNSRGYRNKNPGNIDFNTNNKWQGQVGRETTGNPPRFAVFQSHEYGIRALAMLLTTYQDRHGLRTIRGIINRWAPPQGKTPDGKDYTQDTSAYALHVGALMKRSVDDVLNLHDYRDIRPLVEAIITHELGGQPYSAKTIDDGLLLAGIRKPVETVKDAAQTAQGQTAIQVGAIAAAAATAAPFVEAVTSAPTWVGVAIVVGITVAAVVALLVRSRTNTKES